MLGKIIGLQNYLNPSSWNCVILCDKDFYRYGYIKKVGMRDKLRCSRWTQYNHKALCKPETPTGIYRQLPNARRRKENSQLESLKELSPTDILILSFLSFKTMQLHICVALNP